MDIPQDIQQMDTIASYLEQRAMEIAKEVVKNLNLPKWTAEDCLLALQGEGAFRHPYIRFMINEQRIKISRPLPRA